MTDRITQIQKGFDAATPIAVEANNVFITYTVYDANLQENVSKKCTLQDFFDEWESFKQQAHFIRFDSNAISDNIKLWFETPTVSQP